MPYYYLIESEKNQEDFSKKATARKNTFENNKIFTEKSPQIFYFCRSVHKMFIFSWYNVFCIVIFKNG